MIMLPELSKDNVKIPKSSSRFMLRLRGFFHGYVLVQISRWYVKYCDYFGIRYFNPLDCGTSGFAPLPFNTVLKWGPRVREDEALGITLARSLGLPAPRMLSYGEGSTPGIGTIWMTILPGKLLLEVWLTLSQEEKKTILGEIDQCILRMRQCHNPNGPRISSLSGTHLLSDRAADNIIKPCQDKNELLDQLASCVSPGAFGEEVCATIAEKLKNISKIPHSIVFTHGDLFRHNILVKDGHLSGVVDWECAGWLPEYWDYTTMTFRGYDAKPPFDWHTLIYDNPGFIYPEELAAEFQLALCAEYFYAR